MTSPRLARVAAALAAALVALVACIAVGAGDAAARPIGDRASHRLRPALFNETHARLDRPPRTISAVLVRSAASFPIARDGGTLSLPLFVSQPLTRTDWGVTRAVIVIHGADRNAEGYWDYAAAGLKSVNGVVLVAPKFAVAGDPVTPTQLYWADSGWSKGGVSAAPDRPWSISSFEILDELVARLRVSFPNVRSVIVIGHSAGAQMVQRYAATSVDVGLRFVVMNAGSYLYLSPERPAGDDFAPPASPPADYDDYKYGLRDLNDVPYVDAIGADALRSRYEGAHVRYLLGELDTGTNDADLDVTPAAELQGSCRRERGERFFDYLGFTFGSGIYERHSLAIVPGVGHVAGGMFRSSQARAAMLQ